MKVDINNTEISVIDFSIQMDIFGGGYIYFAIDNKHLNFIKNLKNFNILSDIFIARGSNVKETLIFKNIKLMIVSNDISIKVLDIRDYKIGKILHKNDKLI